MNKSKSLKPRIKITEKQRTLILLVLLAVAVGFIVWVQSGIDENFVDTL